MTTRKKLEEDISNFDHGNKTDLSGSQKASTEQVHINYQDDHSNHTERSPLLTKKSSRSTARSCFLKSCFDKASTWMEKSYDFCGLARCLDRYFKISENGSSIGVEIRAGFVTWITMTWIILVNPRILAQSGIPINQAATSTCLCSTVATLIAGMIGNLPIGCAPGVGLSAWVAYSIGPFKSHNMYESEEMRYKAGLTMGFITGCILLLVWFLRISEYLMQRIPFTIKVSTIAGIGFFLGFVGFFTSKIVLIGDSVAPLNLGILANWETLLTVATLLLITILRMYEVRGSMTIGVIVATVFIWWKEGSHPTSVGMLPQIGTPVNLLDFRLIDFTAFYEILAFTLVIIFDVSGVLLSVMHQLPMSWDTAQTRWAHFAVAIGTILASMTGCSPIIVHLESLVGIAEGGRTGLTAVTIAFLFFLPIFLGPIIGDIPAEACAPVLICIGALMMKDSQQIDWENMRVAIPAFLTISIMPLTYSIANGLYFGIGSYIILYIISLEWWAKWKNDTIDLTSVCTDGQGTNSHLNKFRSLINEIKEDCGQNPYQKVRAQELLNQMDAYIESNGAIESISLHSRSRSMLQLEPERKYSGGM